MCSRITKIIKVGASLYELRISQYVIRITWDLTRPGLYLHGIRLLIEILKLLILPGIHLIFRTAAFGEEF